MHDDCPQCQFFRNAGARFCGGCGRYLSAPPRRHEGNFFHRIVMLAPLLACIIILCDLAYFATNFHNICDQAKLLSYSISLNFGLWDLSLLKVTGKWTLLLIILVISSETACLIYGLYRFHESRKKRILTGDKTVEETTGLSAASIALCVSLFISAGYILLSMMFGMTFDTSWMDSYSQEQMAFMLTRAGIREELEFRVFWIGLPMAVLALGIYKDRRSWQYLFGGFGMSKVAVVLLVISSIIFGLAHYDGWGWAKVGDAALGGIIFGYLYIEYGLYAAVIAHMANDTIQAIAWVGLGTGPTVLVELALMGIGLVALVYWILRPNMKVVDVRKMSTLPGKLEQTLAEQWKRH